MYIVRFVRKDGQPTEDYYYNDLKDAQYHFQMFQDDDSDLYYDISIYKLENDNEKKICSYLWKNMG